MSLSRRDFLTNLAAAGGVALSLPATSLARPKLPFPELSAAGSAGHIGMLHGKRFAPQVKHNVGFYLRWFKEVIGLDAARALKVASGFRPVIERHTPALMEEMQGIARGAGIKLEEVLAVNARTDMLVMGRKPKRRGAGAMRPHALPGCTALALKGRTKGRALLALGQNWDWRQDLSGKTLILRVQRKGAAPLLTFTEAGMVGKIGFNAHRLGVCLNFLGHKTERPDRGYGVPIHLLLRAVMECETLEQAYKLVSWSPRCASANFLIAQHDTQKKGAPAAIDVELTPTSVARIPLRGDHLVHTNHFLDATLAPGCDSVGGKSTTNRYKVAARQSRLLARKIADPVLRMQRILKDRVGAPYSISKTSAADSRSMTLAGIVMDLSRNRLYLTSGPPHLNAFTYRRGV